ncbi:DNA modification methylase [Novipirellula artificiosorum]|uniref:Methyltransferase n=1 Tax=Novipirellula artificiosorum TaxID=2528016 RepID=A0A5C6DX04_9BACT|nr:DNA modification methylase [Novipirellula artificiosorum]TWU39349.1 Modification methylase DpnIIB [Novipirellula artificiosorum]
MQVEMWSLDRIKPYENNPRLNDDAVDAVVHSINEFGFRQPIVVDTDGVIIVGHTRFKAAKKIGLTEVPVHVAKDMEPEAVRAYRIADNRTGENAEWDFDLLPLEMGALQDAGFNCELIGFDADELAKLLHADETQGLTDPDDVPEPPDEAITQSGDIWILGDHRLMCGDSSKPDDLDRLLNGQPIHLIHMDPPYNVSVSPRSKNAIAAGNSTFAGDGKKAKGERKMRAKDRPLANDFISEEEFDRLLLAWFENASRVLVPGGCAYVWGGYANLGNYPGPLKQAKIYMSQAIVWDKQHPVMTRKDFMGAFEICFYGWKEGAGHKYFGPNNATDLWHVKKIPPQQLEHLTGKPAELAVNAMQYSSRRGDNVLDLFGGSGSTLIGAEQTGRKAYLMELDPPYCDVIVDRYQRFTGKPAILERTGESPIPVGKREENMR